MLKQGKAELDALKENKFCCKDGWNMACFGKQKVTEQLW